MWCCWTFGEWKEQRGGCVGRELVDPLHLLTVKHQLSAITWFHNKGEGNCTSADLLTCFVCVDVCVGGGCTSDHVGQCYARAGWVSKNTAKGVGGSVCTAWC
jgi:hypothetical protein